MEVSPSPAQGSAAANGVAPPSFPTIEPERVVEHLAAVCQVALGATQHDLELPGSLLHKSRHGDTVSRCTRFASDAQTVLYIKKDILPSSSAALDNGSDSARGCLRFRYIFDC